MFSNLFERSMINLLEQVKTADCLILVTVPTKSLSLSDKFKNHPLAQLNTVILFQFYTNKPFDNFYIWKVTQQNRNTIINEVYSLIKQFMSKKQ